MLAFALSGVYAIADGFFVGNALGDSALAAVNIAYPLTAFLQAVGTGIGMGGAIQYAISAGTENPKKGRQYFGMSLIMLTISGILLSALLLLSAPVTVSYTHLYLVLPIFPRQYLLRFSDEELHVLYPINPGILPGIIDGLRHDLHAIHLLRLLCKK